MIDRILAAARRGVQVRVVVSKVSNNTQATAALKHRYADMLDAGVEIWELPDTVVHAKVVVADDVVSFGTVNLDAWALYRNSEIMMVARSAETAALSRSGSSSPTSPVPAPASCPRARMSNSRAGSGTSSQTFSESCPSDGVAARLRPPRRRPREGWTILRVS